MPFATENEKCQNGKILSTVVIYQKKQNKKTPSKHLVQSTLTLPPPSPKKNPKQTNDAHLHIPHHHTHTNKKKKKKREKKTP